MLIVLIILLVVLGAGGGYYGHSRWSYGGCAGIGLGTLKVMRKRETLCGTSCGTSKVRAGCRISGIRSAADPKTAGAAHLKQEKGRYYFEAA